MKKIKEWVDSGKMNVLDWVLAIASLVYATYLYINGGNYLFWCIGGSIGLVLAIINPTKIIKEKLNRRFVRKN